MWCSLCTHHFPPLFSLSLRPVFNCSRSMLNRFRNGAGSSAAIAIPPNYLKSNMRLCVCVCLCVRGWGSPEVQKPFTLSVDTKCDSFDHLLCIFQEHEHSKETNPSCYPCCCKEHPCFCPHYSTCL
jgi:hypothetical protein